MAFWNTSFDLGAYRSPDKIKQLNPSKHITLFGAYCCNNIGDDILYYILEKFFQDKFHNTQYDVSIICATPSVQYETQQHVNYVNRRSFFDVVKTIFKSNYVIVGPGSIFSGNFNSETETFFVFFISFFTKILGKKLIFLGVEYSPIRSKLLRFLSLACFVLSDKIYVRYKENYLNLDKYHFLNDKMEIVNDVTYCNYFQEIVDGVGEIQKVRNQFTIVLSDLTSYTNMDLFENFLAFALKTLKEKGYIIKFLSLNMTSYGNKDMDYIQLFNEKHALGFTQENFVSYNKWNIENIQKAIALIGESDFVMSNKLHSTIIASMVGTNIISLSYHSKMRYLNNSIFLSPSFNFDTDGLHSGNIEQMKQKFTSMFDKMGLIEGLNYRKMSVKAIIGQHQKISDELLKF